MKAEKKAAAKTGKKATERTTGKLGSLLGHTVISVVRAMGKHGWKFDEAKAALDKAGIEAADRTVRGALRRGKKGEMKIAPLSAAELETLADAVPEKPKRQSKPKEAKTQGAAAA